MGDAVAHRKIELQSPEDLVYLINNVRKAAADSINAAFPPVEGEDGHGEDELRVQIERLVEEYITKTFTYAAPNLSINGNESIDPTLYLSSSSVPLEQEEAYEPFDARKRETLFNLAGKEQDLLKEIAELKKRVPQTVARDWSESVRKGIEADAETWERVRTEVVKRAEGVVDGEAEGEERKRKRRVLGDWKLERQGAVEEKFSGAVETLERLKRDMPATVAKMERARVAGSYVVEGQ
ncbi:hypothetical protein DL546_000850 [Coniochaeta pulveracea]|uniref:Kinetochore protein mis14 n=1 Tax=Coniochaeta pulveracea TaxID=177199 RepID=A0A420Y3N3_9PEZI|nr:hypothetical protein DL546_000850 [Coniochaeta pulveracea]